MNAVFQYWCSSAQNQLPCTHTDKKETGGPSFIVECYDFVNMAGHNFVSVLKQFQEYCEPNKEERAVRAILFQPKATTAG